VWREQDIELLDWSDRQHPVELADVGHGGLVKLAQQVREELPGVPAPAGTTSPRR